MATLPATIGYWSVEDWSAALDFARLRAGRSGVRCRVSRVVRRGVTFWEVSSVDGPR